MDLTNKTYVVTGATSGIGLATAKALVRAGANVIGVGRSEERCQKAETDLRAINHKSIVRYLICDLSLQAEVRGLARRISALLESLQITALDGLINVAGTFTYWLNLTPDGIEKQWAVNHRSGFMLTNELLPYLISSNEARIISVSSDSHFGAHIDWEDPQLRRRYNGLKAYGVTKLANLLFIQEFNKRLIAYPKVRAFAVDPGLVKTDIGFKDTPPLVSWVWRLRRSGGTSAELPARCILYLLAQPLEKILPSPYWKNNRPKLPSRAALDPNSAARLWELSERLCDLDKKD
jgi:NAD(P)-dependent dehydrogenase (short-subunit alcohol dehydrogenase family)